MRSHGTTHASRIGRAPILFFGLLLALALGCGAETGTDLAEAGGGGGAGSVSVLFTDAPSDDFIAVNVTVDEILLIGGPEGPVTLFEGEETFDLLALSDVSELFSMSDEVPAGSYARLRLVLAEEGLELVVDDGAGGEELVYPPLPPNNTIDLKPEAEIVVTDDGMLALEVDIDVDKSLRRLAAARYEFRPIVFIKVLRNVLDGRLTRLHGFVEDIDLDEQRFALCRLHRPLAWLRAVRAHGPHPDSADFRLESEGAGQSEEEIEQDEDIDRTHPRRRCIAVSLNENASIFDTDGTPVELADVVERDRATVVGKVRPTGDRRLEMFAALMALGPPGTFEHRVGTIVSELDDQDQLVLELRSGAGELTVQLFEETKIFERGGMSLGRDAIMLDTLARATGVILFSTEDPAVLNAAILILDLDDSDPEPLRGEILAIDLEPAEGECAITLDVEGAEAGVAVGEHTVVFLIDGDGGQAEIGELTDLATGDIVTVFGRTPDDGVCFGARVIVAFPGEGGENDEGDVE